MNRFYNEHRIFAGVAAMSLFTLMSCSSLDSENNCANENEVFVKLGDDRLRLKAKDRPAIFGYDEAAVAYNPNASEGQSIKVCQRRPAVPINVTLVRYRLASKAHDVASGQNVTILLRRGQQRAAPTDQEKAYKILKASEVVKGKVGRIPSDTQTVIYYCMIEGAESTIQQCNINNVRVGKLDLSIRYVGPEISEEELSDKLNQARKSVKSLIY